MRTVKVVPTSDNNIAITIMDKDARGNDKLVNQVLFSHRFVEKRLIDLLIDACKLIQLRKLSAQADSSLGVSPEILAEFAAQMKAADNDPPKAVDPNEPVRLGGYL